MDKQIVFTQKNKAELLDVESQILGDNQVRVKTIFDTISNGTEKANLTGERVLEIALEQKRRGADIIKIVTAASNMEEQIENLRINDLLKRELDAPFLFLSGGECSIHRRMGMKLGCCMCLCVYEHYARSTPTQPLFSTAKAIRDDMGF